MKVNNTNPEVQNQEQEQQKQEQNNEVEELKNRLAELQRKLEEAHKENQELREMQLRLLAQQSSTYSPDYTWNPTPTASTETDASTLDTDFGLEGEDTKKKQDEKEKLLKEAEQRAIIALKREEAKKQAMEMYPDLKDKNSEFFHEVSMYMWKNPWLYHVPEGILLACKAVNEERLRRQLSEKERQFEETRKEVSQKSQAPEGNVPRFSPEEYELPPSQQEFLKKLGVSPKEVAKRIAERKIKAGEL